MEYILAKRPEMRYCAFLDILGFKSLLKSVEDTSDDPLMERIISVLNFMSAEVSESAYSADLPVYELTEKGLIERELGDPRLTYVSDCIIISTEHTEDGLKALCRKLSKIWLDLAWDGFFCRGGISEGLLFHHQNIVFGSAYLKALALEQVAITPRVVFDDAIISRVGFPAVFPVLPPTCEMARDGRVYLRYFPYFFFPPYATNWTNYLCHVGEHIVVGLSTTSGRVREKYAFLREEFNFCLEEYRDMLDPSLRPIPADAV